MDALRLHRTVSSLIRANQADILIHAPGSADRTLSYAKALVSTYPPTKKGTPRVVVLAPTKWAVERVSLLFDQHRSKSAAVVSAAGGSDRQFTANQLRRGCDYLIGTPGRLVDMYRSEILETRDVSAVVLEEAETLLSSPVVLDFIRSAIPGCAQRILVAAEMSDWLKDTLTDVTRTGHSMEVVTADVEIVNDRITHSFAKSTARNELRQLRHIVGDSRKYHTVIVCRNAAEVFVLCSDPLFSHVIAVTSDMTADVRQQQLERSRAVSGSVVATCEELLVDLKLPALGLVVNLGKPSSYHSRTQLLDRKMDGSIVSLIRGKEYESFVKWKSTSGFAFQQLKLISADDMDVSFAKSLLESVKDGAVEPAYGTFKNEVALNLQLHGNALLVGLTSLAESRRSLFENRSPLSGAAGYMPILLFDPFMKKFKDHESVEKLILSSFSRREHRGVKLGRIALSVKGFVVDVPSALVHEILASKKLKQRNVQVLCVPQLPRLVPSDKLFALKQSIRDRKSVTRLTGAKQRLSGSRAAR